MSKQREEFNLSLPLDDTLGACLEAAATNGWRVLQHSRIRLICKEAKSIGWITFPVKVVITLSSDAAYTTEVILNGSNWGLGPIQSARVREQVAFLRDTIQSLASVRRQKSNHLVANLETLVELHAKGTLSDEEFQAAKSKIFGE